MYILDVCVVGGGRACVCVCVCVCELPVHSYLHVCFDYTPTLALSWTLCDVFMTAAYVKVLFLYKQRVLWTHVPWLMKYGNVHNLRIKNTSILYSSFSFFPSFFFFF